MKLVIIYHVGDGCTFSCTETEPIEYSSKEEAKLDFGSKILEIQEAKKEFNKRYQVWINQYNALNSPLKRVEYFKTKEVEPDTHFSFGGRRFNYHNFMEVDYSTDSREEHYNEPEFLTIEEWFKK